ncbi:class E sortase [Actinotalea ferrariae]|uniref:class E sortase n=1 Tax=Actinotalea ferrariae TaxID=1386098 RepID=UPI001C8CC3F2|nr:class E sortase [Actinotalea ferrariae]MBX9243441.1 class E sortase [Actinotalea ferrariae]
MTSTREPVAPADAGARRRAPVGAVVVGVLGELLITLGVLLGLFVAWQLWWTDVVADGEQAQVVEDLGWAVTEAAPKPEPEAAPELRRDAAPVPAEPDHLTTFATLQVPRWGPDYVRPISQGTSRRDVLDVLGLGHYEGTAMPGAIGNFAVAGHRTTYGKPLNRVEELQVGDPLVVQTQDTWYVYRVTETQVVMPHQVEVIAPVPNQPEAQPTVATMTLTTCHPMFSARERFIVHAVLDHWMPVAEGVPAELAVGAQAAGGA